MMLSLSTAELLEYRRNLAGLEPLRLDLTIERTDGLDIDHIVAARLRAWYLKMLDTAPAVMLPVADVGTSTTVSAGHAPGSSMVIFPQNCRRPLSIRLRGWERAVPVLPPESAQRVECLQDNPFTEATKTYPVAVAVDSNHRSVMVWPAGTAVDTATCVADPGDGTFTMDEALLEKLPQDSIFLDI